MIWTLLLHLLWKGTLTGAALANDRTLNQIFASLPASAGSDFLSCLASPVNVDIGFVRAGDVVYERKILCGEEAQSVRDGAVQLTARGLFACAKEAAAKALNSFYVDDQGKCFGSSIVVGGEGGTCSCSKLEVYSSEGELRSPATTQTNCGNTPIPDLRSFVVGEFSDDLKSFVATYEPVCPSVFLYELHYDGKMIDDVAVTGRRVKLSTPFPPCTEISTFALQAYDEEGNFVGDLMFAPPVTTPGDCSRIDETVQDFGN